MKIEQISSVLAGLIIGLLITGGLIYAGSTAITRYGSLVIGTHANMPTAFNEAYESGDTFVDGVLYADLLSRVNFYDTETFSAIDLKVDEGGTVSAPTLNVQLGGLVYQTMYTADTTKKIMLQTIMPDGIHPTPGLELVVYAYNDYPVATANYMEMGFNFTKHIEGVTPDIVGFTGTSVSLDTASMAVQGVTLDIDAASSTWNSGDIMQLKFWLTGNGGVTTENLRLIGAKLRTQVR